MNPYSISFPLVLDPDIPFAKAINQDCQFVMAILCVHLGSSNPIFLIPNPSSSYPHSLRPQHSLPFFPDPFSILNYILFAVADGISPRALTSLVSQRLNKIDVLGSEIGRNGKRFFFLVPDSFSPRGGFPLLNFPEQCLTY